MVFALSLLLVLIKSVLCHNCPDERDVKLEPHNVNGNSVPSFIQIYLETCESAITGRSLLLNSTIGPSIEFNETCLLELFVSSDMFSDVANLPRLSIRFWTDLVALKLVLWNCPDISQYEFKYELENIIRDILMRLHVIVKVEPGTDHFPIYLIIREELDDIDFDEALYIFLIFPVTLLALIFLFIGVFLSNENI